MNRLAPLFLFLLNFPLSALADVQVDKQDPVVKYRTFDPRNPPKDMPKLSGQEAAVTHSEFGIESAFSMTVLDETSKTGRHTATIRIDQVKVKLTLNIVVWLPFRATEDLKEHEEAHRLISEHFYKNADQIARALAKEYVAKTYTGSGNDEKSAHQNAIHKPLEELGGRYMKTVQSPSSRVNELFDEITDHGRNRKITAEEGMQKALQKYQQELSRKK